MNTESASQAVIGSSALYVRIRRHCASSAAPLIAFIWGLAEATLFFIVPDVYLGFVALFDWRRALRALAAPIAGAVLGGALMYALAAYSELRTLRWAW
jgi:membrane protein YqaA with SNARE-associated domain